MSLLSAAVTFPYVIPLHGFRQFKMQTQRFLLPYKTCFSWSLWFCILFHKAPALYDSIFRKWYIQRALALCFRLGIKPMFSMEDEKEGNPLSPFLGLYQKTQELKQLCGVWRLILVFVCSAYLVHLCKIIFLTVRTSSSNLDSQSAHFLQLGLPGGEQSYFCSGICGSFADSGKSCRHYNEG